MVYYCGTVTAIIAVIAVLAYRVNIRNLRLSTVIYGYRGIPRYFAVFYTIQLLFNFFLCLSVIFIIFVGNFLLEIIPKSIIKLRLCTVITVIAVYGYRGYHGYYGYRDNRYGYRDNRS